MISTIELVIMLTRTDEFRRSDGTWFAGGESATSAWPPSTAVARRSRR